MTSFEQTLRAMGASEFDALAVAEDALHTDQLEALYVEIDRRRRVQELREKYAGYALMGLLANSKLTRSSATDTRPNALHGEDARAAVCKDACRTADALIKELGL